MSPECSQAIHSHPDLWKGERDAQRVVGWKLPPSDGGGASTLAWARLTRAFLHLKLFHGFGTGAGTGAGIGAGPGAGPGRPHVLWGSVSLRQL